MEGGGSEEGKFRVGLVWENARTPKTTSRCLEITLGQGSPVANGSACWPSQPTKRRRGDKHGEPAFLPEARYPSSGVPLPPLVGRRQGPLGPEAGLVLQLARACPQAASIPHTTNLPGSCIRNVPPPSGLLGKDTPSLDSACDPMSAQTPDPGSRVQPQIQAQYDRWIDGASPRRQL